jgi:hypothetical protein
VAFAEKRFGQTSFLNGVADETKAGLTGSQIVGADGPLELARGADRDMHGANP